MDYEKLYKEKLRKAKELYYDDLAMSQSPKEVLEELFTELAESEGERIRKELIDYFSASHAIDTFRGIPWDRVVAWLEKQGEQKPADKIEPKFHEGEWIVKNDDSPINIDYSCCKITKVENGNYTIESIYGYKGYNTFETFEKDYHLWTINDAKDGDVLCTYECDEPKIVFILKGTPKIHYALRYHCYYNIMYPYFASDSVKGCLAPDGEDVKPATKEQCDLLFQKMKEAGYEWNAEKILEAKQVQQPAWSKEDEKMLEDIKFNFGFTKEKMTDALIAQYDRFFDKVKYLKPQPKQEWGEEDERMLDGVIGILESWDCSHPALDGALPSVVPNYVSWLNSLKEKYTWKPSDEQIKALEHFVRSIGESGYASPYDNATKLLYSLLADLKKLREE